MSEIAAIVDRHLGRRGDLIAILEEIQSRYTYLPEESLREVAQRMGCSLVDIYGVATFYRWFSLEPRGRHLVTCCQGTACHVRGAPRVLEGIQRELNTRAGQTTADREFTLETQACLGACALGPIVVADGHYYSNVLPRDVARILQRTREGLLASDDLSGGGAFPVEASCGRCGHSLMNSSKQLDGRPAIELNVLADDRQGWVRLSSLYGSPHFDSQHPITEDTVVVLSCPHCNAELSGAGACVECASPMAVVVVRGGGVLKICSRRGCHGHGLDLPGAEP